MDKKKKIGNFGESFACRKLRAKGYKIVCRNFRRSYGEIDIIAENDELIAFVEVKTRNENYMYEPIYAVTRDKQRRIIKTAQAYMMKLSEQKQVRFDVFEVIVKDGLILRVKEYTHTENAFGI